MDSTEQTKEYSSECRNSDSPEPLTEKDPSAKLITGFVCLFFLFIATTYLSQTIIFQSLGNFSEEVKNMEVICDSYSRKFNDEKCRCAFHYVEGLDHPHFQYYFHRLQLPNKPVVDSLDSDGLFIDPQAYVIGCGNNSPEREHANKAVCEQLDIMITTDLYTKWWYDTDAACFNSIFSTMKRANPVMLLALILVLVVIAMIPVRLLQAFRTI